MDSYCGGSLERSARAVGGDPVSGRQRPDFRRLWRSELPTGQGETALSLDAQGGCFGQAAKGPHAAWDGGVQVLVSEECDVGLRCLSSAQGFKAGTQGPSEPITGTVWIGLEFRGEPKPGLVVGKTGRNQSEWGSLHGRRGSGGMGAQPG